MGNTIGTRIHIRNSQEYLELSNFYDPKFDMKYDQLLSLLSNEGVALSEMLGANSDKVELFTLIHILSKLDGGDELLQYFNSLLNPDKQIAEKDILINRLSKIFHDYKDIFDADFFLEIEDLYSKDSKLLESKIVKIVYALEMIAQSMRKQGKWSHKDSTNFVFNSIKEIGKTYNKRPNEVVLNEEYIRFVDGLNSQNSGYINDFILNIKKIAQDYNENVLDKNTTIDMLKTVTNKKKVELGKL